MPLFHIERQPNGEYTATEAEYDLGRPTGWRFTQESALADLVEQIIERNGVAPRLCDDKRQAMADCDNQSCRWSGVCSLAQADYVERRRG
jgi:hypothetical protein